LQVFTGGQLSTYGGLCSMLSVNNYVVFSYT
jgi:hypothetical protein